MNTATQQFITVWQSIFDKGLLMQYQAEQEILYEGHAPYGVYVFVAGVVNSFRMESGRRIFLEKIPLFLPIGCDLILSGKPYDRTLVAEQDVIAYFFSRTLLKQHLQFV